MQLVGVTVVELCHRRRVRTFLVVAVIAGCGEPAGTAPDASADAPANVTCTGGAAGSYCGGDSVDGGDPATLYQCPGAGMAPTSAMPCAAGCVVEPTGTADHCMVPMSTESFRLPWQPGVAMQLTQDCNDACCSDHVGTDKYAYDWANGGSFTVVAARGGTITHLKINSATGCGTISCENDANYLVIDHGDGTQSTYLHLAVSSLEPGVACGATVVRGQPLARSGTTGWSTGIHLHFQVSGSHPNAPTCECGAAGQGCSATSVPWSDFWVNATYPSAATPFDEWPAAPQCANRRIAMPASQNL